jgi:hypothetical protein
VSCAINISEEQLAPCVGNKSGKRAGNTFNVKATDTSGFSDHRRRRGATAFSMPKGIANWEFKQEKMLQS